MIQNICHLNYQQHHVHVSRDLKNRDLILFKYNDSRCDFAVFKHSEWDLAAEYVLDSLPEGSWQFVEDANSE